MLWHSRQVVYRLSQQEVQYECSIWLNSQQFSHICVCWNYVSLRGVLSHLNHRGRMAMYSISHKIGVKSIIIIAAKTGNQKDELRALASFITQIKADIHSKNIIIADRNRISFWKIVVQKDPDSKGFQITFHISQLHSIKFIAVCVKSPVPII